MKGSLVNRIDLDGDDESSRTTQEAAPTTEEEVTQGVVPTLRNSRANESHHNQRNDQTIRTSSTLSDVVNHADLDDIEAPPPSLSRQEPFSAAAPQVTLNRPPHRRMLVDVDDFMEESNKDVSKSADDSIPSVMPNPQRSASQNAAIKAVLGYDDFDKGKGDDLKKFYDKQAGSCGESVAGQTADLSEDEIAAIIPPNLQRQSGSHNSTPGAFPVPGRGGVVPTRTFHSTTRRPPTNVVEYGDGIHMISATLVGSQELDMNPNAPMLVYAERLWWKRRLVLCVSVWMIFAISAISASITSAVRLSRHTDKPVPDASDVESDEKASSANVTSIAPTSIPSKSPIDLTPSPVVVSPSPTIIVTQSPIAATNPPATLISVHAVSWGVLTSCSDFDNKMQSYEMNLSCVGTIELERYDNIDCTTSVFDSGKMSCRLNSSDIDASTNNVYQQANGLALFSCRGSDSIDLVAGAELFNTTVSNCSLSSSIGTASAFVSMGQLCQDGNNFFDILSKCVNGENCLVLPLPSLPVCIGNDIRKLNFFDDAKEDVKKFINDTISFCFETTSCSDQSAPSQGCSLSIPKVSSLSSDTCSSSSGSSNAGNFTEADLDDMWSLAQTKYDPSKRIDAIIQYIL